MPKCKFAYKSLRDSCFTRLTPGVSVPGTQTLVLLVCPGPPQVRLHSDQALQQLHCEEGTVPAIARKQIEHREGGDY